MADNVVASAAVGVGPGFATANGTWSGDADTNFPGCFLIIASGSEGAWTFTTVVGGAGVVTGGVQRMTLASDDPGVVSLQLIDDAVYTDGSGTPSKGLAVMGTDGTNPQIISVTAAGLVNIADGSGSITVDNAGTFAVQAVCTNAGTFAVQAAQSGTWTVELGATDNAVLDAIAASVAGTLTVGSHAVTNAGTFVVQENGAALTALQLIDNVIYVDDADWTATTSSHALIGGVYQSTPGTITDGDTGPLRLTANGAAHVSVQGTVTVGSHAVTNAGTFAVQVDGSALTALQLIDDAIFADDAAFTIGTSKVMVAGGVVDDASTDSADEGDAAALRVTTTRQLVVNPQPHTSGGLSIFRSLDLDETEEEVKATAGQVYGAWVTNTHTATLYLKFYNATAANVTVGTTTPVITIPIPGNSSDDISAVLSAGGYGIAFDTAITVAVTTGLADADTGAPGANAFIANIFYK